MSSAGAGPSDRTRISLQAKPAHPCTQADTPWARSVRSTFRSRKPRAMNYRDARKIARKAEKSFGLPGDTTLQFIQNKLETQRGRKIQIDELPGLAGTELC